MRFAASLIVAMGVVAGTPALAEGDAAAGEKVFRKCAACHAVGEGAKNKVGPALNGIVGSPAGQAADFKYSPSLTELAAGGLVWDVETLSAYLAKPRDVVPKGRMAFAGLRKDQEIADVIAYLQTFQ